MMFSNNKKNSLILDSLSKTLPDDRPITSLQIIENLDKCPSGFYSVNKSYDQDQDADLWRESSSFLKKKSLRYLCLSKTEGLPNFILEELVILNEKSLPPEGYSLLNKTADTGQRAWRKKQICYRLVNKKYAKKAVTDIIVCSRSKKAPFGFTLAGEINGVIVCYKMGNVQDSGNGNNVPPERPPKPGQNAQVYPRLNNDDEDHDYEILSPPSSIVPGGVPGPYSVPSRPAPVLPPTSPQHTNTLSSSNFRGLEGVPFVINSELVSAKSSDRPQFPTIKARTVAQVMKDYNYDFRLERQSVLRQ